MRRQLRKYLPDHEAIRGQPLAAPFENTLLHPRLWDLNRHSAAGAVAAGMFCGLIPGPLQMLGAAICAVVFRVNLPLAMLTTLYTNPFTIVPLYVVAYAIGSGCCRARRSASCRRRNGARKASLAWAQAGRLDGGPGRAAGAGPGAAGRRAWPWPATCWSSSPGAST
jgi:uncharacterized protein (DUF2062 family)